MQPTIDTRLTGSRTTHVMREFFTNSVHFPLANLYLELLIEEFPAFFLEPDAYVLLLVAAVQAYVLGTWRMQGRRWLLLGNLIGPALYTVIEVAIEGLGFFSSPYHLAYWGFAVVIGLVQQLQPPRPGTGRDVLIVVENVLRSSILLAIYWIFEALTETRYADPLAFFADTSHTLIAGVVVMLGVVLGFSQISAGRYLAVLAATAVQLRIYSEWLLGSELLSQAVDDPQALALQRRERTMLFMDIRGFTQWSETREPEVVVAMLNEYFETAEAVWPGSQVIKIYFTADEIMAIFPTALDGVRAALRQQARIGPQTARHGLAAGIGVNTGTVVEGLIGSAKVQEYNVIGDAVNTAKRICDKAPGGSILISETTLGQLGTTARVGQPVPIAAKGKREPVLTYVLEGLAEDAA